MGLGAETSENPFTRCHLPAFDTLGGGRIWTTRHPGILNDRLLFQAIDARLGVSGLPQSGTGQATLFTGVNCAKLASRHFGPFPHSTSLPIISDQSIFKRILDLGESVCFANAYPPRFFEYVQERNRWPVTTRCCLDASVRIRTLDDLAGGTAVAADITGAGLRKDLSLGVSTITEKEAADRLVALAANHRFTAFEYFHTDKAGHAQDFNRSIECLVSLDRLISGLLTRIDRDDITLIVTSDHGNIEDLSIRTHTLNPVPLAVYGPAATCFKEVRSLTDVVPAILGALAD